jgi:hypothetical protein
MARGMQSGLSVGRSLGGMPGPKGTRTRKIIIYLLCETGLWDGIVHAIKAFIHYSQSHLSNDQKEQKVVGWLVIKPHFNFLPSFLR